MDLNVTLIRIQRLHLALLFVVLFSSFIILIGSTLASTMVSADDSIIDEVSVAVPVACTMNATGQNSHNTNIVNGTYTPNIGSTTLHALCNDNEGFAIYAAGYTGDEVGGESSNKLVGTAASNNATIESGIATSSGNSDISNWAMKLAITGDSGDTTGTNAFTIDSAPNVALPSEAEQSATQASFSQYHVVPNEYVKVAHKNSNTDMAETIGGVKLTTTYAAYISKTQAADTYSGQVIYTLVHPSNAMNPGMKSIDTATTMQEVTFCADSLSTGHVYTLIDSRDETQYKVAKLADGNCWMLENLALDPTNSAVAANLNESNTNASAAAIFNFLNGGNPDNVEGWSTTLVSTTVVGGAWYSPVINAAYKDTLVTSYGLAASNGVAKVGVYYNICAASVGTRCDAYEHDIPGTDIDVEQDVCPSNWRMPTSGNGGDYVNIYNSYNEITDAANILSGQYNLSTPLSGDYYFDGNSVYDQNLEGLFWSSTYANSEDMLTLKVSSDSFYTKQMLDKGAGASVRCVLKND